MSGLYPSSDEIKKRHGAVAGSRTFKNLRRSLGLEGKRVLDLGCGYGEYLAHFGFESVGITTTAHEIEYGKKEGLRIIHGNAEMLEECSLPGAYEVVWANNLYEHLLSPHAFLMTLKNKVTPQGEVVLGVPVVPLFPFLMRLKPFRGALATNHINFYTKDTLRLSVERAGWNVRAVRPFLFRSAWLDALLAPFAPHLYLVAVNNPSFSYPAKKVKEWEGEEHYEKLLAIGRKP